MRLLYHPSAAQEISDAAVLYESKAVGLGTAFLEQVDAAAEKLLRDPQRWPVIEHDIRRIMLKRFPFGIYFRIADDTVRVLTLKHHRQHPGYGMQRR
ncbi:MAG: type II toxin-antitoxin system RelE/ParE family toxin [Pseudomonadota bacterium]